MTPITKGLFSYMIFMSSTFKLISYFDRLVASEIAEKSPRGEPASGDLLREFQRLKQKPTEEFSPSPAAAK